MSVVSRAWWAVIVASFVGGGALAGVGFWLFDDASFLENLIAEGFGILIALGVIIWLIEGPILTRERRVRAILEYRRRVFQIAGEIVSIDATDMAGFLASILEPQMDLDGPERGRWAEFKPLLREVFRRTGNVRQDGLPKYIGLDEEEARSIMTGCLGIRERIKETMDEKPEFAKWEVLGSIPMTLEQMKHSVERAERLELLSDPITRYEEIGHMGEYLLEILDTMEAIASTPNSSELW